MTEYRVRGCFYEKTRTGASFIPVWLFYFVSRLHVVYMMTGSFHTSLFEGTLHVDETNVRFNLTHALPVAVYWQTDFTPKRVVVSCLHDMIPLRDFVPEWNSRPSTTTWVNSRRVDARRHDILWWYHVNKCRAMRGNRSGLVPAPNSLRCHVNTPLRWRFLCSDWCAHLARWRFPLLFPQENFSFWSDNKSLIDSGLFGQDGWKLAYFFFLRFYCPRLRLRQINWQYPAMLTSCLVNNVYIACLLGDTRGNWVGGPRYTFLNIDTEFAFRWVQVLWPSLWRRRGHDPNNLSKMRISVYLSRVRELWRPVFLRTPVPAVHWLHL